MYYCKEDDLELEHVFLVFFIFDLTSEPYKKYFKQSERHPQGEILFPIELSILNLYKVITILICRCLYIGY